MNQKTPLDPRLHPFKADVAALHLGGQVAAERFVEGTLHRVREPVIDMMSDVMGAGRVSQALFGEDVMVYDTEGQWCWGQLLTDNYVGWVSKHALVRANSDAPTHRVAVPLSHATEDSIKVLGTGPLPMGARLRVSDPDIEVGGSSAPFAQTDAGTVPASHLVASDDKVADWVAVAEQFLGAPYVWGGRSALGLDCSALVQLALQMAGVDAPRDSDMQEDALGHAIDPHDGLIRGDLVFWRGHVAIMLDPTQLIHANAWNMAVAEDNLADVDARIRALGGGAITSYKRL